MFTVQQQALLREAGLRDPEPFLHTDFKRPFVYDPKWGVFYCASGAHPRVMATLCVLHLGETEPSGDCWYNLAEHWLEHYHGCYKSSCSNKVTTWNVWSLQDWERAIIEAAGRELQFQAQW